MFSKDKIIVFFFLALFLFSCLAAIFSLGIKLFFIPLQVEWDINEAWNAFHLTRLSHHLPLYPPQEAMIANNYPPLSFYLYMWLHELPGFHQIDLIAFGRSVAAISCFVCGILLSFLSFKTAQFLENPSPRVCGLFSFVLFMLLNAGTLNQYFAMYDPQWTGEALMLCGLVCLISFEGITACFLSAFFLILAGFIKHNLAAAPLAVTLWLLLQNRRLFLSWCVISVLLLGAGLSACWGIFGISFFQDVLGYELGGAREHSVMRACYHAAKVSAPILFFIGILWASFGPLKETLLKKSSFWSFWLIFAGIGFVLGFFGGASSGCDVNVYFDFVIAVCILSAPVFSIVFSNFWGKPSGEMSEKQKSRNLIQILLVAGIILTFLFVYGAKSFKIWHHAALSQKEEMYTISVLKDYLKQDRNVACWSPADCFWAGGDFLVDPSWKNAVLNPSLLARLKQHNIHAVLVNSADPVSAYLASFGGEVRPVSEKKLFIFSERSEKQ
ncbi:hypothetical protein FAI41_03365 [Acetobacteraceae bacterium]|nr:hypothetical protein FAI41_03365 [Acetobacteraceae bacterium]